MSTSFKRVWFAAGASPALLPVALDVTNEAHAKAEVDAAVRRMFNTNSFGLLNIKRTVLPVIRKQRSGHVVNMSSVGGYRWAAGFGVLSKSTDFAA